MAYDGKIIIDTGLDTAGIQKDMLGLNKVFAGAAAAISLGALAKGFTDVASSIVTTGMEFEKRLSGVKAISSATAEEMDKLKAAALEAGAKTVYTASESAQAIEELMKAGLSTSQVLNGGLTGALNLASAGEIGLKDAAEIASTALNAFRDDQLSVSDAANILAGAANASATDIMELKYGLSMSSAVASGVGMTFRDTATALAVFAQNGLKGSDAGTSLKTMLSRLTPLTDSQAKAMEALGLMTAQGTSLFYDETGSVKSLAEISQILKDKLGGLNDEARQTALYQIFGSDAIRAGTILFKEGADGINDMWSAMSNVTAADVAKERLNNLAGSVEYLKGSVETVGIKIYTGLQTPMKDAVDTVGEAVNDISHAFDGPEMQGALSDLGDAIRRIAAGFGDFLRDQVPKTISGLSWLTNNFDSLMQVVKAAAASIITFKAAMAISKTIEAVTKAVEVAKAANVALSLSFSAAGASAKASAGSISLFQLIVGAVTGKIKLATAAQAAWNAVSALFPAALIAAAIGGIVLLGQKLLAGSDKARKFASEIDDATRSLQDLNDEISSSSDSYADQLTDLDAQTEVTRQLIDNLYKLNSVNTLTSDQQAELANAVKALNDRFGEEVIQIDSLTGHVSNARDEVEAYADSQNKVAKGSAAEERLNELYAERTKLQDALLAGSKEISDKEKELASANVFDRRVIESALNGLWSDYEVTKQKAEDNAHDIREAEAAVSGSYQATAKASTKSTEIVTQNAQETSDVTQQMQDDMEASYKKYAEAAQNAFKKIEQNSAVSAKQFAKNLNANAKTVAQWTKDMATLTERGLDEGVIEYLRGLGPEGAKQVRKLAKASDSELAQINKAWGKTVKVATTGVQREFADPSFTGSGADAVQTIASKTQKAADNADFEGTGEGMAEDMQGGVEGKTSEVAGATKETVQNARSKAAAEVADADFDGVGRLIDYGIAQGIRQDKGKIEAAMQEAAEAALAAAKRTLQISSPSKRTMREIGKPAIDGIVEPFRQSKSAEQAISGFLDRAMAAARSSNAEAIRGTRAAGLTLATAGDAVGAQGINLDALVRKLVTAGAFQGTVVLDNGEKVGRWVAPAVSRAQGSAYTTAKRSGYRG